MKAVLIDPIARTVTEVDWDGNYQSIYRLIDVELFTCVNLPNGDALFVDDEGLLKDPEYFFTLAGYAQPLAGKGLVLGTDAEGESIAPVSTLAEITAMIGWARLWVDGFRNFSYDTPGGFVIGTAPEFSVRTDEPDDDDTGD